ncbi:hypothetical protein [uncultured Zoogloea sp.]|uniref:hypothetical protein n=1 Tax=uncultured Zoogloea sp. TaxID=160237 RepID=UPI00261E5785|nr:hypothetical protein [uncultured Zoogloea sp.]
MQPQTTKIVGIAWYAPEHYDAILGIMADRHKLSPTFHEWRMNAESLEKKLRRDGNIVVRTLIDPKTFPDWCRSRGLNVDAQARMEYANAVAKDTADRTQAESGGIH